jgi:hypothetical protein
LKSQRDNSQVSKELEKNPSSMIGRSSEIIA